MEQNMATQDQTEGLVSRAQAGDRCAFDEIVHLYTARLKQHIHAHMGNRLRAKLEVEDILQQTFMVAFETIDKFQWRGEASFYHWLGSISKHLILSSSQKRAWHQIQLVGDGVHSRKVRARVHAATDTLTNVALSISSQRPAFRCARR